MGSEALLVQALIERELRLAMKRERIARLPIYPEQRFCARPTTEQILALFSLVQRHTLAQDGNTVQIFDAQFTDLQRQVLTLLGVSEQAFQLLKVHRKSVPNCALDLRNVSRKYRPRRDYRPT